MKDKEKQIEEMAKYLQGYLFPLCNDTIEDCIVIASALISQGWVKLPKDSVVLSSEEYENILEPFRKEIITLSQENTKICDEMNSKIVNERKETAEKIYRELQGHGTTYIKKWIKERFGVEIKE